MSDLFMQHVAEGLRERIAELEAENSKLVLGPRIEWINISCQCGFKGAAVAKNNVLECPGCKFKYEVTGDTQ